MSSDDISLVLSHHHQHLPFRCTPLHHHHHHPSDHTFSNNNHNKTTRELTGFIEHQNHRHYHHQTTSSPSDDGSDDVMDDDEDAELEISEKNCNGKRNHPASIGNDMNDVRSSPIESHKQGQLCQYQNALAIADPNSELYYSQYRNGAEGSDARFKDMLGENGCGFSGRKDISNAGGSGESLRRILSDPLTGALMDDAMILPCGHSFGSNGMQHVMRMKACYTCSHPVSEGSAAPNLSLQSAVQAFLREEELRTHCASKRRNRLYQDKTNYGDSALGRGVPFPFCVAERVIIKGNKRTPPRFVGREAVVTTQCLNGWYVVKTLDNAESVKLQYRSLSKIPDSRAVNLASSKITPPNWL
ncbi:U-box domain-containing protein 62-like [Bidens hawaiensis]|uniref:U-box domain-containing protein 62-like n=1 Tax=Bidens hawaiensis TaxID=980011 RepID=UPI0040497E63